MDKWIRVRYRSNREDLVDDVTLNELIVSKKIKQFYRPSEKRWVNIETDPVRGAEKLKLPAGNDQPPFSPFFQIIAKRRRTAPVEMAESATLYAGQWFEPM